MTTPWIHRRLRHVAPFLFGDRALSGLTRQLAAVGGGERPDPDAGGPLRRCEAARLDLCDVDLGGRLLTDWRGAGLRLTASNLHGATWRRSDLLGSSLHELDAADSRWEVLDLEGATLHGLRAAASTWSLVSLRDADLRGCDLGRSSWLLCDLSGATLRDCDLREASLVGCDLEGAVLDGCDLRGADLEGCDLRGSWLAGARLDDARVEGADLRSTSGLDSEQRGALRARGARVTAAPLPALWARLLGDGPEVHRRVRAATAWTWATLALLLPLLLMARAILHPVVPDLPP